MVVSVWGYQGFLDHHSKLDICALQVYMLGQELPNIFVKVYASPLC